MLHLLEPIWLIGMAGIVAPVIVHLWNDRRGKVLRVGSVALLEGASKQAAWSRRITEWWLLVLRCLLVMAVAFLLAGPYLQRRAAGKGWVLVSGVARPNGPYGSMIDSLVRAGYERHVMNDTSDYWAAFAEADREAPAGTPFYIFSSGLVSRFRGMRPETSRDVHWYVYAPEDSVERWTHRSWASGKDSMVVLTGVSRATGTNWERHVAALEGSVDTSVLRFRVHGVEARYVAAAVKALAQVTGRSMVVGDGRLLHLDSAALREAVLNGRLPMLLADSLPVDSAAGRDRRMIDPGQVAPVRVSALASGRGADPGEDVDLRWEAWWLVVVLFLLERLIVLYGSRKA